MARTAFVLDGTSLTRSAGDHRHPLWWGFLGMIAIETTVFTSLVVSYFYLRMSADAWPPEPLPIPELPLPTMATLILLASSGVMHWSDKQIRRDQERKLAIGLTTGIALAVAFLGLKAYEYLHHVEYRWDDHAYGSIVWTIVGFHSAHVIALVLKTTVVATLAWRGYFSREWRLAITTNGIYWHFVVIIWIPLYLVLYWAPRFL